MYHLWDIQAADKMFGQLFLQLACSVDFRVNDCFATTHNNIYDVTIYHITLFKIYRSVIYIVSSLDLFAYHMHIPKGF